LIQLLLIRPAGPLIAIRPSIVKWHTDVPSDCAKGCLRSIGLAGSASRGLESGLLRHEARNSASDRTRHFRRIVMRGFNRTVTMACTQLILGVHLERVNQRIRVR
jgi:hypothetical protein